MADGNPASSPAYGREMHFIEMQDTAFQIADAEKAVVDAKEALSHRSWSPHLGPRAGRRPKGCAHVFLLEQLGITWSPDLMLQMAKAPPKGTSRQRDQRSAPS